MHNRVGVLQGCRDPLLSPRSQVSMLPPPVGANCACAHRWGGYASSTPPRGSQPNQDLRHARADDLKVRARSPDLATFPAVYA
ncbi:unnamed protein product, partial [Ectocarpus sp. 13 AM-2016]